MKADWKKQFNKLIASLKSTKEAEEVLDVLLTPAEYDELSKRWQIVAMLLSGETQRCISDILSVSTATVSRGAKEVKYGTSPLQKYYDRIKSK